MNRMVKLEIFFYVLIYVGIIFYVVSNQDKIDSFIIYGNGRTKTLAKVFAVAFGIVIAVRLKAIWPLLTKIQKVRF